MILLLACFWQETVPIQGGWPHEQGDLFSSRSSLGILDDLDNGSMDAKLSERCIESSHPMIKMVIDRPARDNVNWLPVDIYSNKD